MTFHTVFKFPSKKRKIHEVMLDMWLWNKPLLIYRGFIVSNTVDTDLSDVHKIDDLI